MPQSAVLRTLHAAEPGDIVVFTHGTAVTDVWYCDPRRPDPVFYRTLPVDPATLADDFTIWRAGPAAQDFVAAAVDGTAFAAEDADGDLLAGARVYGEWWVTTPTPLELASIPWGPNDDLTATAEVTLHRHHLQTMTRAAHILRP